MQPLIEALNHDDEVERRTAVADLIDLGNSACDSLVLALSDARPRIRWGSAMALGRVGAESAGAVCGLIEALRDPVERVRDCATQALAALGEAAVPALTDALTAADTAVQARAAIALGQIGPPAGPAVARLAPLLSHDDDFVRLQAATALGRIGVRDIAVLSDALEAMVDNRDFRAAESLVVALRETGARDDVCYAALVTACLGGNRRVRDAATLAIRAIDPTASIRQNKRSMTARIPGRILAEIFLRRWGPRTGGGS